MPPDSTHNAYGQMLKATSVVAGAKIFTILVSMVRMKVIASVLGPGGLGMVNLVSSSVDFARVLTSLGLDGAVVRSVADANSTADSQRLAIIYRVAVRTALLVGLAGWLLFSVSSPWISTAVTGHSGKAWLFALGSASLIFTPLLGVQLALLQGLRQIKVLALCQLVASPIGALTSVLLVVLYGTEGAVAALVATSLTSLIIHFWFLRTLRPTAPISAPIDYRTVIRSNLRDGSGFAINGLWLVASGWINLILIRNYYGADGMIHVGMYSAASMLANFYVGIVISALATEFFPSLTAESRNPEKMNLLLNRQAVLALDAGVVASLILIVLAPLALRLLYSSQFYEAADIMRVILVGTAIRFASFPLGFTLLAMGKARLFAICEILMGVTTIGLSMLMINLFGLMGLGAAIVIANFIQATGLWLLTRKLGMSWDHKTLMAMSGALLAVTLVLSATLFLHGSAGYLIAGTATIVYAWVAASRVKRSMGVTFQSVMEKIRSKFPT